MLLNTIIQDVDPTRVEGEQVEKTLSIIELITTGGTAGMVIIAILFILFIVAIYIYFERIFAIKEASKVDSNFMNQIRDYVSDGKSAQIGAIVTFESTLNIPPGITKSIQLKNELFHSNIQKPFKYY